MKSTDPEAESCGDTGNGCANCSLTKHSRDGNKLAEQGNEILEYSWYKSGQNPPAGKDRVMNLFNY